MILPLYPFSSFPKDSHPHINRVGFFVMCQRSYLFNGQSINRGIHVTCIVILTETYHSIGYIYIEAYLFILGVHFLSQCNSLYLYICHCRKKKKTTTWLDCYRYVNTLTWTHAWTIDKKKWLCIPLNCMHGHFSYASVNILLVSTLWFHYA